MLFLTFRNNLIIQREKLEYASYATSLPLLLLLLLLLLNELLSLSRHFSRKYHFRFVCRIVFHSRSCSSVIRPARRQIVNSQIVYLDCKSPSVRLSSYRGLTSIPGCVRLSRLSCGIVFIKPNMGV